MHQILRPSSLLTKGVLLLSHTNNFPCYPLAGGCKWTCESPWLKDLGKNSTQTSHGYKLQAPLTQRLLPPPARGRKRWGINEGRAVRFHLFPSDGRRHLAHQWTCRLIDCISTLGVLEMEGVSSHLFDPSPQHVWEEIQGLFMFLSHLF